jgi:hypothetical protein
MNKGADMTSLFDTIRLTGNHLAVDILTRTAIGKLLLLSSALFHPALFASESLGH